MTYIDTAFKNAIKFKLNGIEELKKLLIYSGILHYDFFEKYKTIQEKIEYFNDALKYDNIPIKELEEFQLMTSLSIMVVSNYI